MSMKKMKSYCVSLALPLLISFFGTCQASGKPRFDPALQTALDVVVAQKNETEQAVRKVRKALDASEAPRFITGYLDMTDEFNKAVEIVKTGDKTPSSQPAIRDSVRLNRVWIENIMRTFPGKFDPIDEILVDYAWTAIFTASQTLDKKGKKNLSKYLEKNAKWKTWSAIRGELG